ncbi:hypothetical protein N3930_36225, partial [Bacillus thuringiensis]|nr:hypothetical protein [Bacillus thuringiensis]
MTTLKTIHISMFTKIKNYMLVLKQNERVLEEPIHDYKLFQFMCQLEMNNIHKVLEGHGKDTQVKSDHAKYLKKKKDNLKWIVPLQY